MRINRLIFSILIFFAVISGIATPIFTTPSPNIPNKILDQNVAGDVYLNPLIKTYIEKHPSYQNIATNYTNGSRVYCLSHGKGKRILICGGIHGDEVQGSLSVLGFLYYLKKQGYSGTIYIIPFAIPIDTEKNTRTYNDSGSVYDPNRKANVAGTPVNKILNFAVSHRVKYIVDVHSGLGVNEKGMVYYQSNFEKRWALSIQRKTQSEIRTSPTNGTLRSEASKRKINAITLEVEKKTLGVDSPVQTELNMIKKAYAYLQHI